MVLDASEDDREKHRNTHGGGTEYAKRTHLAQCTRKADQEAHYSCHDAPNDRACCGAIRQGVEQLRADETVECWRDVSMREQI